MALGKPQRLPADGWSDPGGIETRWRLVRHGWLGLTGEPGAGDGQLAWRISYLLAGRALCAFMLLALIFPSYFPSSSLFLLFFFPSSSFTVFFLLLLDYVSPFSTLLNFNRLVNFHKPGLYENSKANSCIPPQEKTIVKPDLYAQPS